MMMSDKRTGRAVALLASVMMLTPDLGGAGTKNAKPMQPSTVFNAEKRKKTRHDIGQHLSYSMYSSFRYQGENNRRRDDGIDDRTEEYVLYLGFVGRADLGRGVIAFGHAELDARSKATQDRRYDLATQWTTKEAFVSFKVGAQARVTLGRMRFSDPHKWVADLAVDGVHYGHKGKQQVTEFAAFRGTGDVTASYLMAHHGRVVDQNRYGVLALFENDGPDTRAHLAGYASVLVSKKVSYELNLGAVMGDAANGKSAGFGIDVRSIRKFGTSDLNPQMMFGFAAGTGGYRQSGLHSNKTYNRGQTQVHRYGYAFQPDLTNLVVGSLAVGVRPSRKLSVDLGVHAYAQFSKSTTGPSARFHGATTGNSAFLGTEVSLAGAWRPSRKTKVEFGVGHFNPGPAYIDQTPATRVYLRMTATF